MIQLQKLFLCLFVTVILFQDACATEASLKDCMMKHPPGPHPGGKAQYESMADGTKDSQKQETGNRKLMQQSSNPICFWNDNSAFCNINYNSVSVIYSQSTDKFANFVSIFYGCHAIYDATSCVASDLCYWNAAFGLTNAGSPCVKAAPKRFLLQSVAVACQQQTTDSKCWATKNCSWANDNSCSFDPNQVYFGFESLDAFNSEIDKIYNANIEIAVKAWSTHALSNPSFFDWDSALDWTLPPSECPTEIDPRVCKYTDAYLGTLFPVGGYCDGKYDYSVSDCNKDELCNYDQDMGVCSFSDAVVAEASAKSTQVLIDTIPNIYDREYYAALLTCGYRQHSKCDGYCQWDTKSGSCVADTNYLDKSLASVGKASGNEVSDPVCKFLEYKAFYECGTFKTASACNEHEVCAVNNQNAAKTAADIDDSQVKSLRGCYSLSSKAECNSLTGFALI